jgi:hypothetical protein
MAMDAAELMRRMRDRRRLLAPVVHIDDLAVTCWCESTVVHVRRADLLAGRTASCGNPHCTPDEAA